MAEKVYMRGKAAFFGFTLSGQSISSENERLQVNGDRQSLLKTGRKMVALGVLAEDMVMAYEMQGLKLLQDKKNYDVFLRRYYGEHSYCNLKCVFLLHFKGVFVQEFLSKNTIDNSQSGIRKA